MLPTGRLADSPAEGDPLVPVRRIKGQALNRKRLMNQGRAGGKERWLK